MSEFHLDPAIVLAGGVTVPVTLLDGKQSTAFVRFLRPGDEYLTLILLADDFAGLAEFITGHPLGWAKTLHPASILDLAEKALDLNFSLARRWAELRAKLRAVASGELPPGPEKPSSPSTPSSAPTPRS